MKLLDAILSDSYDVITSVAREGGDKSRRASIWKLLLDAYRSDDPNLLKQLPDDYEKKVNDGLPPYSLRMLHGLVLCEVGEQNAGMDMMQAAAKANPSGESWVTYGRYLDETGDTKAANDAYKKAIEKSPDDVVALDNYATTLNIYGESRFVEMESAYLKALSLEPKNATVHEHYGWLLIETERYKDAVAHCKKALRYGSDINIHPLDIWKRLAIAYKALGKKRAMKRALSKIREIGRIQIRSATPG